MKTSSEKRPSSINAQLNSYCHIHIDIFLFVGIIHNVLFTDKRTSRQRGCIYFTFINHLLKVHPFRLINNRVCIGIFQVLQVEKIDAILKVIEVFMLIVRSTRVHRCVHLCKQVVIAVDVLYFIGKHRKVICVGELNDAILQTYLCNILFHP